MVAKKKFIIVDGTSSNQVKELALFSNRAVDYDIELSADQSAYLQECLSITKSKIYDFGEFLMEYMATTGRNYIEDKDPPAFTVFDRDPKSGYFRPNKQKSYLPKESLLSTFPEEFNKFSQKDRKEFYKNKLLQDDMDRILKVFKRRDTKGNIKKLQEELDSLAAQSNPLKKCLSMYKIKEKMDKIESKAQEQI